MSVGRVLPPPGFPTTRGRGRRGRRRRGRRRRRRNLAVRAAATGTRQALQGQNHSPHALSKTK